MTAAARIETPVQSLSADALEAGLALTVRDYLAAIARAGA